MDGDVERLLTAQGGAGSVSQLLAAGASRRVLDRMVRRKELVRVRNDAVLLSRAHAPATLWERRALEARAVGHSLAPGGSAHALSHQSALMVHGLPYFGEDDLVHLVRTDGHRGRRDATIQVHRPVDATDVVEVDGIRVVTPALAALQMAASRGPEAGIVSLDAVLRRAEDADQSATGERHGPGRAALVEQLERHLATGALRPVRDVRTVVSFADGRSQSAGESRSRWLLHVLGWASVPQFEVRDGPVLYGVVDLKIEGHDVIVEFDGSGKYGSPDDLLAEKRREDQIRDLGYEVVRLTWSDLAHPRLVRQKILKAIARAESRAQARAV